MDSRRSMARSLTRHVSDDRCMPESGRLESKAGSKLNCNAFLHQLNTSTVKTTLTALLHRCCLQALRVGAIRASLDGWVSCTQCCRVGRVKDSLGHTTRAVVALGAALGGRHCCAVHGDSVHAREQHCKHERTWRAGGESQTAKMSVIDMQHSYSGTPPSTLLHTCACCSRGGALSFCRDAQRAGSAVRGSTRSRLECPQGASDSSCTARWQVEASSNDCRAVAAVKVRQQEGQVSWGLA